MEQQFIGLHDLASGGLLVGSRNLLEFNLWVASNPLQYCFQVVRIIKFAGVLV